ncbi:YciI family protein [Actinomycetospora termitidis]|uniref:YciI family protein n=1 Tax=Actinomycetospora termitidis TaxID=3053470 RepID=A0ABT7MG53_9PSEU|nr:YciI family protein [Actinomycetospora sp. Odt1-22]MDL5159654.1 YciI family protein [Actinomycetospora sp. Odt1-22]
MPPVFVCLLSYHQEIDRESALFAAHRGFVEQQIADGRFLCSGPRVGVRGGLVVAYGDDEAEARALFDRDPFVVEGVAGYELHQFRVGLADPASHLTAAS